MDVTIANSVEESVFKTIQEPGSLDILVNNASIACVGPVKRCLSRIGIVS